MKRLLTAFVLLWSITSSAQSGLGFSSTPKADSLLHAAYLFTAEPYDTAEIESEFFRSYYQNQPELFRYLLTVRKVSYLRKHAGECLKGFVSTQGNDVKRLYNFMRDRCPEKAGWVMSIYDPDPVNFKISDDYSTGDSVIYTVRTEEGVSLPHRVRFSRIDENGSRFDRYKHIEPIGNKYKIKAHKDERVKVDADEDLPDVHLLNNQNGIPVEYKFNPFIKPDLTPDRYTVDWRPDLWYNAYDGFKVGGVINGSYMNQLHNFTLRAFYNTGLEQEYLVPEEIRDDYDPVNFIFDYDTYIERGLRFRADARLLDGLRSAQAGLDYFMPNGKSMFYGFFRSMYRPDEAHREYLFIPEWGIGRRNHKLHLGFTHEYNYDKGMGMLNFELVTSSVGSDYDFSYFLFESKHEHNFWKFPFRYRLFGQYGSGSSWAPESQLFIAGANPEEYMSDPFTRSQGIINRSLGGGFSGDLTQLHYGGGLNLRGYSGYFAPYVNDDGETVFTYSGTTGASVNAELVFSKLFFSGTTSLDDFVNFEAYFFGDAGIINANRPGEDLDFADLRADAGVGGTMEITQFGKFNDLNPLTLRVDLPLFLNRPPADQDFFEFRFILGISKAF